MESSNKNIFTSFIGHRIVSFIVWWGCNFQAPNYWRLISKAIIAIRYISMAKPSISDWKLILFLSHSRQITFNTFFCVMKRNFFLRIIILIISSLYFFYKSQNRNSPDKFGECLRTVGIFFMLILSLKMRIRYKMSEDLIQLRSCCFYLCREVKEYFEYVYEKIHLWLNQFGMSSSGKSKHERNHWY